MGTKVYSEIAIKNAIRILAKAGKAGQLTKEQVDAAFEALGIEEARTPEECAAWAREWTPSFFRAFLEAISFTRGYHSIDDIVTAVKERLAA